MLRALTILKHWAGPVVDEVVLDYEDRHRRRAVILASRGTRFLLDLPDVPDMRDGDGIQLSSTAVVLVRAAEECLIEIASPDERQLARIAWHIGNRHIPAEFGLRTIRIRVDHVIADMVVRLGCEVQALQAPFNPESGAYSARSAHSHRSEPVDFETEDTP